MWYNYWYNYWNPRQITFETAIQTALQHVPGQVIKVELSTEHGIQVYEVKIRTYSGVFEVDIDAKTGFILKIESIND